MEVKLKKLPKAPKRNASIKQLRDYEAKIKKVNAYNAAKRNAVKGIESAIAGYELKDVGTYARSSFVGPHKQHYHTGKKKSAKKKPAKKKSGRKKSRR